MAGGSSAGAVGDGPQVPLFQGWPACRLRRGCRDRPGRPPFPGGRVRLVGVVSDERILFARSAEKEIFNPSRSSVNTFMAVIRSID